MTLRLVILDRDGVLNVDRSDYVTSPEQLVLIPNAAVAVGRLTAAGLSVVLATNQACVAKGLLTPAGLDAIHERLRSELSAAGGRLDRIYAAVEAKGSEHGRRKPSPAMLLEAMADFGATPAETIFIGDAETDQQAASAAGVRFLLTRTGHGRRSEAALGLPHTDVFDDLLAAVQSITP